MPSWSCAAPSGKQTLDFVSNLGGAVPGTILGIGYIIVFIQAPWFAVVLIFVLLAAYLASRATSSWWLQLVIVLGASALRLLFQLAALSAGPDRGWLALSLAAGFLLLAVAGAAFAEPGKRRSVACFSAPWRWLLVIYNLSPIVTDPLGRWGRTLPGVNWPKVVARLVSFIQVFTRPNWRSWATPSWP